MRKYTTGGVDVPSLEEQMRPGYASAGFADPDCDGCPLCDDPEYSPEELAEMEAMASEWERRHLGPTAA
jgi:hypothetical protein